MLLQADRLALRPGQAVTLEDGVAWRVAEGAVDVFTARDGARRFLFAAPAGAMLWGTAPGMDGRTLIAVAWEGATLHPLDRAPTPHEVDGWIGGLLDGAAHGLLPHPPADRRLRPAEEAAVRAAEVVSCRAGVAWLAAPEPPLLLGLDAPRGLVPVTPLSWATATAAGDVACLDTATVLARPDAAGTIAAVTDCIVSVLSLKDSLGRADDLIRLRERDRRDREALAEAGLAAAPAEGGDRLLAVVRRLAGPLGAVVRRPAKVRAVDADKPLTLAEIAAASGLRARPVRLRGDWWRRDLGALLVWRRDGTPLAVEGGRLVDGSGSAAPLDAAAAASLRAEAHVLHRVLPSRRLAWPEVLAFDLGRGRGDVAVLALTLGVGILAGAGLPLAADAAVAGTGGAALVVLAVAVVAGLFAAFAEVARLRLEGRMGEALGAALWDRVLRLPLAALRRGSAGQTLARAEAPAAVQAAWRTFLSGLPAQAGLAVGGLAVLATEGGVGVGLAVLGAAVALSVLAGVAQGRALRSGQAAAGRAHGLLFQMLSGLPKIRLAAAEDRAFVVWHARFREARAAQARAGRLKALHRGLMAALPLGGLAWLVDGMAPGVGAVAGLAAYAAVAVAAGRLGAGLVDLLLARSPAATARPLLDAAPEPAAGRVDPGRLSGEIEVTGLTFSYAKDAPPVLRDVGFHVPPGAFVAIVGRSGGGKSTLARLLLGLDTPDAGAVFYDGFDLRGLDLGVVRRQIGTVLQGGRLMPGSLLDIVRGDTGADMDAVRAAVEAAGLGPDVAALPMGLHTLVTDAARTLSGGQVQRLLLARAIAAAPPIFLLDEATSALDNRTQARVMAHLAESSATRLVIAHRLSTVVAADRILVLEDGRIAESGTWEDLVAAGGRFAGMVRRQAAP